MGTHCVSDLIVAVACSRTSAALVNVNGVLQTFLQKWPGPAKRVLSLIRCVMWAGVSYTRLDVSVATRRVA